MLLMYWKVLVFVRFILLLLPSTGYIHPDEFFQSVEVVAGDVLNLKVHRSWEFDYETANHQRIRNIAIPYATIGIPITVLTKLADLCLNLFNISLLSSYTLLVASRIFYALLSLLIDRCLYQICRRCGKRYDCCLLIFGSSYVTLIYLGHSLSNSIEAVLYAVLIDSVTECIYRRRRRKKAKNQHKGDHSISISTKISVILILGIFNRPTFVIFALVPMLFWTCNGEKFTPHKFEVYFRRGLSLVSTSFVLGLILVITDTIYYDSNFITNLFSGSVSVKDLIVTPINFVTYNLNSENLAIHGTHPRWIHILVNNQLLFGPLSFSFIVTLIQWRKRVNTSSTDFLMTSSSLASLLLMSIFSHQEPRFLIGLVLPLVFLCGERVISSTLLSKVWIIFNIIGCIFYGFVHQAGVISSLNFIRNYNSELQQNLSVVYYHTYMPPRFMLLNERSKSYEIQIEDLMGDSSAKLHAIWVEGSQRKLMKSNRNSVGFLLLALN
ncbi:hypothetical protein CHUAL_010161 [Chamberlinius hualienensis]